ncbi:hypothetical protein NIES2119_29120 [[Phormidium ambiguum] IAM M-71]|uniref:Uncharacterized protein n=1 Tax=[Phormidium ambiguum] IAM M-71 TaxID=454136 RepID=A0A1U7I4W3_9CYAN|nr:hypothetical protein NIES2119_29120 [Phormidium ambiguum IAM M-71]
MKRERGKGEKGKRGKGEKGEREIDWLTCVFILKYCDRKGIVRLWKWKNNLYFFFPFPLSPFSLFPVRN